MDPDQSMLARNEKALIQKIKNFKAVNEKAGAREGIASSNSE
jgi:hypothetical protein